MLPTAYSNVSDVIFFYLAEVDELAGDLRDNYIEDKHGFDVDEWPPDQPTTVVNVALIHYKGSRTEQELIEISKRHKEGASAIDKLVHRSKVTKDISTIFQTDLNNSPETKPPKFILIEGAPGIGKTVLTKKIAYLWAKKELLIDVRMLFLLFLRDPELQSVATPEQLIQYMSCKYLDEEQAKICLKQIMKLQICIVMDGFDEYPMKLRRNSFIANLIKGRVFRNCVIVLTSRPTATIKMHGKVDRRVEILGFAQEERDKYISESLDSPDKRKRLQDYLIRQPIINGLVYVPLHLAILLYLFKLPLKLPETLTEMNESFILHTIYRSMAKDELTPAGPVTAVDNIKDLPKNVLDIVMGLAKLAFIGLQNNQLVFSHDEIKAYCPEIKNNIPGAFNGFGLLQVVQHLPGRGAGATVSFNFLHFTMQEFLAALYVSNIVHEQQLSLMETTFWNSMYSFMWMMYVGINGMNSQTFMQFIFKAQPGSDSSKLKLSNSIKLDKIKCLHLFQCFMEAKIKEVPKDISSMFISNIINFHGLQLLPHHISSLTLYISKYSMQLQSLNLRDCHIGDVGMSVLEHYFITNPDKASSIEHIDLFGNDSVLLWNVYCAVFGQKNLKKLNWSSLGGVSVEEIVNVMNNNTTVQSLNLSNNHFKNNDAEKFAPILNNNTTLQELDFSENNITTRGAIYISECLQNNVRLQHLKMSWNDHFINTEHSRISFSRRNIKDVDVRIVANILCNNLIVTILDLSHNKISDNGAESISKCIKSNTSLKKIDVSNNRISNHGLKAIAVALQINQTVQKFIFSHNKISDDGVVAISECLLNNTTLKELNVSHNRISNNGIIDIGKVLESNMTLELLDISYNEASDVAFCHYLKKSKSLQNRISWNDAPFAYCVVNESKLVLKEQLDVELLENQNISVCPENDLLELVIWKNFPFLICRTNRSYGVCFCLYSCGIQHLDLSFSNITDDGAVVVCNYVKLNKNILQELNVSHNEITNKGVVTILKSISNSSLHTLNLMHNILTKPGLLMISDVYKELINNICSFHISYNEIVDYSQAIETTSVYLHSGFDQVTTVFETKLGIQNMRASYRAKVLCFCAKDDDSVKALDISNHDITSKGVKMIAKALQGNTSLRKLDISHNCISDDGAVVISKFLKNNNTLQELNLSYNEVSNLGIISISKCLQINSTLQTLDISHNDITDDGAIAIGKALRSHYKDNSIVTTSGDYIENCMLQKINLSYNNISSEGIVTLSDCLKKNNTLKELAISWNHCEVLFVVYSTNNFCNTSSMHFGDIGVTLVTSFLFQKDKVQKLDLSFNNISDDGAVAISEYVKFNKILQELNVSHNEITNEGVIAIVRNIRCSLHTLNLTHNVVTKSGLIMINDAYKQIKNMCSFHISYNEITDYPQNVNTILAHSESYEFDEFTVTSKMQLDTQNMRASYRAKVLCFCAKDDDTVEALDISNHDITSEGAKVIAKGLQGNTSLQKLNISHNNIFDNGAVAISNNNTLHELYMSYNKVSNIGIINISAILQSNTALEVLDISNNSISNDGAVAISEFLKNNNTLLELDMSHNEVSNSGIISIGKALQINVILQILKIMHNNISDDGAIFISECLKNNSTLQELDLSYNEVSIVNIDNQGVIKLAT